MTEPSPASGFGMSQVGNGRASRTGREHRRPLASRLRGVWPAPRPIRESPCRSPRPSAASSTSTPASPAAPVAPSTGTGPSSTIILSIIASMLDRAVFNTTLSAAGSPPSSASACCSRRWPSPCVACTTRRAAAGGSSSPSSRSSAASSSWSSTSRTATATTSTARRPRPSARRPARRPPTRLTSVHTGSRRRDCPAGRSRRRAAPAAQAERAPATSDIRCDTTVVTPSPRIVTP